MKAKEVVRIAVSDVFRALAPRLKCPCCQKTKPKEVFGIRIMKRDRQGFPVQVRRQSYCAPCRGALLTAGKEPASIQITMSYFEIKQLGEVICVSYGETEEEAVQNAIEDGFILEAPIDSITLVEGPPGH